jgi:hypothetical protein
VITDWLNAGALISARVTAQVSGLSRVQIVSSVSEAASVVKDDKSCFVAWGGESATDYAGRGAAAAMTQRWNVVVAVRPGVSAGTLLSSIITALMGHELSDRYDGLMFRGCSEAVFTGDFALYPLIFEVPVYAG